MQRIREDPSGNLFREAGYALDQARTIGLVDDPNWMQKLEGFQLEVDGGREKWRSDLVHSFIEEIYSFEPRSSTRKR